LSRLAITCRIRWAADDQLFQLEDPSELVVDGVTFRDRGGELAASINPNHIHARPAAALIQAGDRGAAAPPRAISPA
jgi:hypothetical protein